MLFWPFLTCSKYLTSFISVPSPYLFLPFSLSFVFKWLFSIPVLCKSQYLTNQAFTPESYAFQNKLIPKASPCPAFYGTKRKRNNTKCSYSQSSLHLDFLLKSYGKPRLAPAGVKWLISEWFSAQKSLTSVKVSSEFSLDTGSLRSAWPQILFLVQQSISHIDPMTMSM